MALFADAVKAAAGVVFGTGIHASGGQGGSLATDAALYDPVIAKSIVDGMDAGELYRTQPNLRMVVSFVARNGAQLGRHVYAKGTDDSRERVKNGPAADLLTKPNDSMTGFDLFNMLFTELALYDMAIWVPVLRDDRWQIDPIPMEWVTGVKMQTWYQAEKYRVQPTGGSDWYWVNAEDAVVFRGYSSQGFKRGSSAVESLRGTLGEQVDALTFRKQMWKRGGRVGMFMTRPKDAPTWSPEAKAKFVQNWKNTWSGTGANAGATPLLEDGMELKRVGFTAKEEQWIEAATLSKVDVAGAYHVPPAMVGVSGYNSFASVKEFRKMLYTETLGPLIAQVEETWNTFLMPLIGAPDSQYLELNIQEKLQGDFEEQAAQLFQAVGGPYMTAAEARKTMNLPFLEGTNVLLAPLNMGATGNNGPEADEAIGDDVEPPDPEADDTTPKSFGEPHDVRARRGAAPELKAPANRVPDTETDALGDDLKAYFARQRKAVIPQAASTAKADPEWWNQKHWNRELTTVLQPHLTAQSAGVARAAAGAKGLDPDAYSVGQTANFLKSVAESRADLINSTTRDQLVAAIDSNTDPDARKDALDHVYDVAIGDRAPSAAKTMGTMLAGWAMTEMARQLLADREPKKRWVTSGKRDSRHSSMHGETVPVSEKFSNGADWPGDPVLGAKGVANCACGVDIIHD